MSDITINSNENQEDNQKKRALLQSRFLSPMTRVYLLLAVFFEFGWGGGIRTPECQDQNLVPYRLATAQ